jgi:cytochrome c oxidase subunit 1
MLFALGFVSLFVSGGLSGLFLAQPSLDLYLHDTYFVIAHCHLIMGVAAIFGMFAGAYFWFPKMFGKFLNEGLGKVHFWLTFVGVYGIFMPMHFLGLAGHPRRYFDSTAVTFLQKLQPVHVFITVFAIITISAAPLPVQRYLELDCGEGSQGREPMACDDSGMVDPVAASAR